MKRISLLFTFLCAFILTSLVSLIARADDIPADQFLAQILDLIRTFGGLPWAAKVAGVILLIVGSMKVSFLRPFWDKLGNAQAFLAPALGMIAGIVSLGIHGQITLPAVMAYAIAGAGAVLFAELLHAVESIPGLGAGYLAVIHWLEGMLGGGGSSAK